MNPAIIEIMEDALEATGDLTTALKAAAERGYVLAKLPERITNLADVPPHVQDDTMGTCRAAYRHGWSQCLDAIETEERE